MVGVKVPGSLEGEGRSVGGKGGPPECRHWRNGGNAGGGVWCGERERVKKCIVTRQSTYGFDLLYCHSSKVKVLITPILRLRLYTYTTNSVVGVGEGPWM